MASAEPPAASRDAPAPEVFAAFGAGAVAPQRMRGGRGRTWLAGDVVVRPSDNAEESRWKASVLAGLAPAPGFRIAQPIAAASGDWVCDGWEALQWLPGEPHESRPLDVIRAGNAFHAAIADVGRPAFLPLDNPWSRADLMAWGELPVPHGEILDALADAREPVAGTPQLIHGDLLGNVLFAEGLPPAVIDWAPYWRPPGFAAAVVAVDATCWHGWPAERLGELGAGMPQWRQFLVRALIYRVATQQVRDRWDAGMRERHEPVAAAILNLAR